MSEKTRAAMRTRREALRRLLEPEPRKRPTKKTAKVVEPEPEPIVDVDLPEAPDVAEG